MDPNNRRKPDDNDNLKSVIKVPKGKGIKSQIWCLGHSHRGPFRARPGRILANGAGSAGGLRGHGLQRPDQRLLQRDRLAQPGPTDTSKLHPRLEQLKTVERDQPKLFLASSYPLRLWMDRQLLAPAGLAAGEEDNNNYNDDNDNNKKKIMIISWTCCR